MALSEKQELFVREYLVDLNATQAYIRAGYSPKAAHSCASRLLENAKVRTRVDQELAARSVRTGVTADRVVRELARLAFVNPTDVIDIKNATLLYNATEDDTAAIASVKVKEGEGFTEREIKLTDKLKALELLGKHLGMFADNINLQVELPQIVDDIGGCDNG